MDMKKLTTAQIVLVASGAVALLGSFLPWYSVDIGGETVSEHAWGDAFFPTYTWVGIAGAVVAVLVLMRVFTENLSGSGLAGFTWHQITLVLSLLALLLAVSFLIAGEEFGAGYFLSLLASIGLVVGAFMEQNEGGAPPPL